VQKNLIDYLAGLMVKWELRGKIGMRSYNRWLFHEHFELVITMSQMYKKMDIEALIEIMNVHFAKPIPPTKLTSFLNQPPWSKYDLDSLIDDFPLFFYKL
jgi:hypothetical protein